MLVMILSIDVGATWQPFQFKADERYDMKATINQFGKIEETTFILELKETDQVNADGEPLSEVSFTTKNLVALGSFNEEESMNLMSNYGMSLTLLVMNPMYSFIFDDLDLLVGEKMSLYGAGIVKVTTTENISGRQGYVCQLYIEQDGEDILNSEWVIDPELAIPLRSRVFEEGGYCVELLVTDYQRL